MEPFVALTTWIDPEGGGHRKPLVGVYSNYLQIMSRVGLTAVLITPAHTKEQVAALVRSCSGLVLSGGEDIDPSRYGEEALPELGEVSLPRDAMEWRALDVAREQEMPIFGICRGMQVLNVYFGGSLYQDLPSQRGEQVSHAQDAPWGHHQHEVQCVPDSRIHEVLGECQPLRINSFHHQAVKDLAPHMRCTAQAEDGLIEAIEHDRYPWLVGVQWHPERHEAEARETDPNIQIVQAFAGAVRDYAGRSAPAGAAAGAGAAS